MDDVPAVATGEASGIPNDPHAEPEQVNFDDVPFESLIADGSWKARKAAYDRISAADDDIDRDAFMAALSKLTKDVSGPASDSFVEALAALIDGGLVDCGPIASLCTLAVVEKALVGRPRAVAAGQRVLRGLCTGSFAEPVFAALRKAMAAKAPKLRFAAAANLAGLVDELGIEVFPLKPLVQSVIPLFNDSDAKVRKEAMNVTVHCYRSVGTAIEPFLADLRDVQRQELAKLFEAAEPAVPRSKPPAAKASRGVATGEARSSGSRPSSSERADYAAELGDVYDDQPETNVVGRIAPDFFAFALNKNEPWKQRAKRVEDELLRLLSAPRIAANADYGEVVKAIRELLNDPQLPIMNLGFRCAQAIAKSLRVGMAPFTRFLIPALFDKFKDKKPATLENASATIALLLQYRCVVPDQLFDEFASTCNSKLPNHRHAALKWATGTLTSAPDPSQFTRLASANALFAKLVIDEKLEVRDAACTLAARVIDLCGPVADLEPFLAKVDDKQYAKVTGMSRSTPGGRETEAVAPPRATRTTVKPRTTTAASRDTAAPSRSTAVPQPTRRTAAPSRADPPSAAASVPAPAAGPSIQILDEELFAATALSPEDARQALVELLGPVDPAVSDAVVQLGASEWRVRVDAATLIMNAAAQHTSLNGGVCAAAFLSVVRAATQWRESMFQVVNINAKALCTMLQAAESTTAWTAFVIVQGFVARLTEAKSREAVCTLFTALTEQVGPRLVIRLLTAVAGEAKNPKLSAEVLAWVDVTLQEFADSPIDAKALLEFVKSHAFEQPNPAVKSAGVRVLVSMRRRVGERFDVLLGEINPHLRKSYDAEVAAEADAPRRAARLRRVRNALELPLARPNTATGGSVPAASGDVGHSQDFPPADVSPAFAAAFRQLSDTNDWRIRAKGAAGICDAIDAAGRCIAPPGVTDAFKNLKPRLEEPNKNFVTDVLRTMNLLADSVVPATAAKVGLRHVFQAALAMLGDQKQALRDEALRLSAKALSVVGLDQLLTFAVKPMTSDNQIARAATADMIVACFRQGQGAAFVPRAMIPLVNPMMKMLIDRNVGIRVAAEEAFAFVLGNVGFDVVARSLTSFKPADQKLISPVLDRVRPVEPTRRPEPPMPVASSSLAAREAAAAPMPRVPPYAQTTDGEGDNVVDAPPPRRVHADPVADLPRPAPQAAPELTPPSAAMEPEQAPPRPRAGITASDVAAGLRTARPEAVAQLCIDLESLMHLDIMAVDVKVVDALLVRAHSFFHDAGRAEAASEADVSATMAVLQSLCALCGHEQYAAYLSAEDIQRLLNTVFECLTSEVGQDADALLRPLNRLVSHAVAFTNGDAFIKAVFELAKMYVERDLVEQSSLTLKLVELPGRCLRRFVQTERKFSPEQMLWAAHDFLDHYPPSRLQQRAQSLTRTVKMVLQHVLGTVGGDECLALCERLMGSRGLVYAYLQMMRQQDQQNTGANSDAGAAQHQQPASAPHASTAPPDALGSIQANVAAVRKDQSPVALIFARARKQETSQAALREMAQYCQSNPNCSEFATQFEKCSQAFQQYLSSNLARITQEEAVR